MKKYYFYLESFVFLFLQDRDALLYDSLTGKSRQFALNDALLQIMEQLQDVRNMYVVSLGSQELDDPLVMHAIEEIRSLFWGDLIAEDLCAVRPVVFPPQLDFQLSKQDGVKSKKNDVLQNLNELTIKITDKCTFVPPTDSLLIHKQTAWFSCVGKDSELDFHRLIDFVAQLGKKNLPIHITGGNIFEYSEFDKLSIFLSQYERVSYYVPYACFLNAIDKRIVNNQLVYTILVDYPFDFREMKRIVDYVTLQGIRVFFKFIIKDMDTYQSAVTCIETCEIAGATMLPVYDNNMDFFRESVFFTEEDLEEMPLSKKDIFAHQVVNTNSFGKLFVDCDGSVYTNINLPSVASLFQCSLSEIIMNVLDSTGGWFRIRDMEPCCHCIYQWICPSPSDYDFVIGRSDLCHILKKSEYEKGM